MQQMPFFLIKHVCRRFKGKVNENLTYYNSYFYISHNRQNNIKLLKQDIVLIWKVQACKSESTPEYSRSSVPN